MLNRVNIACWITASRLALLPVAVLPLMAGWSNGWFVSAVVCTVAGMSDAVDGYVARRTGCVTAAGGWLDLISDKVFVSAMLGVLAWSDVIPMWLLVVVVAREAAVTVTRLVRFGWTPPASDAWGKAKMAVSMVAIVGLLLRQAVQEEGIVAGVASAVPLTLLLDMAPWVLYMAVALTVASGANYLARYAKRAPGREAVPETGRQVQEYIPASTSSRSAE